MTCTFKTVVQKLSSIREDTVSNRFTVSAEENYIHTCMYMKAKHTWKTHVQHTSQETTCTLTLYSLVGGSTKSTTKYMYMYMYMCMDMCIHGGNETRCMEMSEEVQHTSS